MKTIKKLFGLSLLSWLLFACASTGTRRQTPEASAPERPRLFGVAGSHLAGVDPATGAATGIARSPAIRDVGALAFDPATGKVYGIADSSSDPKLIAIDAATGEAETIGPIDLPTVDFTLAEALAFNPGDGLLYAAGGRSTFASDRLVALDAATGQAREVARIRGTTQNEVDALVFAGGALYAVDAVTGTSTLYAIDPAGRASPLGEPFPGTVTDLAFDSAASRLLGTVDAERLLLAIPLDGGSVTEVGPTHREAELDGEPLSALTFVRQRGATLFADGFESGDSSAWRRVRTTADEEDEEPR